VKLKLPPFALEYPAEAIDGNGSVPAALGVADTVKLTNPGSLFGTARYHVPFRLGSELFVVTMMRSSVVPALKLPKTNCDGVG
jgi:hypothetical protein